MKRFSLRDLYASEFGNYSGQTLLKDLLAGLTVAAVALPLALAFGVASGASAASGLITAILAGLIIGALSGAPYQISGPTGAMSAVLIVLAQRYGLKGIWISGVLSGLLLLLIGVLRLGRFIAFIPAPVITGFTSGIALIIAVGQLDNFLGVKTPTSDSAALKLFEYMSHVPTPNIPALMIGVSVIVLMCAWPTRWNMKIPASLLAIVLATILQIYWKLPIATIGEIPNSLFLDQRLHLSDIPWDNLSPYLIPTLSITALGAIESLLCGAVASHMTGVRLHANIELVAQGIGNVIIPFFGGVPATAAIARTSVGIKSGGRTRMVSIFHALALLVAMFAAASLISEVPLSALAGVLIVTAWRMNEWPAIHFYFSRRLNTAILKYFVTLIATVTLDLSYAILIGCIVSAGIFLDQSSRLTIETTPVDVDKLRKNGINLAGDCDAIKVAFITGPLFFAAVGHLLEAFHDLGQTRFLILSVRGMPSIDSTGLRALFELHERLLARGGKLLFVGISAQVQGMLERSGFLEQIGKDAIFWSSDEAIVAASKLR